MEKMKKAILCLLLPLAVLTAAAQPLPSFDELKDMAEAFEDKSDSVTDFVMLDYIGYGIHGLMGADALFSDHTSLLVNREIYFNLLGFVLRPGKSGHHALTLGVDLDWDNYRLDAAHMWVPEDQAVKIVPIGEEGIASVDKSILRVLSFDIPLDYTLSLGKLALTLGAAAQVNLPGRTRFIGTDPTGNEIRNVKSGPYRATNIKTNALTWNAHAQLNFSHIGLYAEYDPMPVFAAGYGPQFSTWSVGLILR